MKSDELSLPLKETMNNKCSEGVVNSHGEQLIMSLYDGFLGELCLMRLVCQFF